MEKEFSLIKKFFPDLEIKKYDIIKSGCHSLAIIVNEKLVFRFPLKEEFNEEYYGEKNILDKVRPFITTKIPNIKIYKDNERIFTAHKIIHGTQYSKAKIINKEKLSKEIALFIYELHSVKDDELNVSQFKLSDYQINERFDLIINYLKNPFKINVFNKVIDEFEKESLKLDNLDNVISHNDINENNILINEEGALAGIIDFGNSSKCNYNVDFSSLLKYDSELILNVIKNYEELSKRKINLKYAILVQKIRCYGGIAEQIFENNLENTKIFESWLEYIEKNY